LPTETSVTNNTIYVKSTYLPNDNYCTFSHFQPFRGLYDWLAWRRE